MEALYSSAHSISQRTATKLQSSRWNSTFLCTFDGSKYDHKAIVLMMEYLRTSTYTTSVTGIAPSFSLPQHVSVFNLAWSQSAGPRAGRHPVTHSRSTSTSTSPTYRLLHLRLESKNDKIIAENDPNTLPIPLRLLLEASCLFFLRLMVLRHNSKYSSSAVPFLFSQASCCHPWEQELPALSHYSILVSIFHDKSRAERAVKRRSCSLYCASRTGTWQILCIAAHNRVV